MNDPANQHLREMRTARSNNYGKQWIDAVSIKELKHLAHARTAS